MSADSFRTATTTIAAQIAEAAAQQTPLILCGSGGKKFYGNPAIGTPLSMSPLSGVLEYNAEEGFIVVGAATSLATIESLLAKHAQMLAFEPPHFKTATAGGAIACGLSGPRRPAAGALRDYILGLSLIDGHGRHMTFGGKIIKEENADFNMSKLMAGAMGTFGAITEVIFRVVPRPEHEITLVKTAAANESIAADNEWFAAGLPLSGGVWHGGQCWRRLSGNEESLRRAIKTIGGDLLTTKEHVDFWHSVREQTHSFFAAPAPDLWRIVAPPKAAAVAADELIEWHGAVRWRHGHRTSVLAAAKESGGAATLFRAADSASGGRFPIPAAPLLKIYHKLKKALDPADILNRGRLYDFGNE